MSQVFELMMCRQYKIPQMNYQNLKCKWRSVCHQWNQQFGNKLQQNKQRCGIFAELLWTIRNWIDYDVCIYYTFTERI